MQVLIDVYDGTDRVGSGPILAQRAQVKRALDGAGSWRANVVATDLRVIQYLVEGRWVRIWTDAPGGKRLMGEGVITERRISEDQSGPSCVVSGPDLMEELRKKNVLLARSYNQQTLLSVCQDLIGLVPGWSVEVESAIAGDIVDARFDGITVLRALREVAERYGLHMRNHPEKSRTVQIGAFGEDTGLRVNKVELATMEALANPKLLMVRRIQEDRRLEAGNYYNVLIPIGAGEGTAALTLAKSTRTGPYAIQSVTGPDGSTIYYLSTTTYPTGDYADFYADPDAVMKVGQFKEIAPLSNSETDIVNAANALYDAAVEELARRSVVQAQYGLTVMNVKENLDPGDKIQVDYIARVQHGGQEIDYLNIKAALWILDAAETVTLDGRETALSVSNIDRREMTGEEMVVNAIEQIELRTLKPNIYAGAPVSYVYPRLLAPGFDAEIPIEYSDKTTELLRVRLRLVTGPLRATATAAASGGGSSETTASGGGSTSAAGGDHNHLVGLYNGNASGGTSRAFLVRSSDGGPSFEVRTPAVSGSNWWTWGASGDHTHTIPAHTHDITLPNHTHALDFGITDDTETPSGITLEFQGVDVTNTLFGSARLAPSGGAINVEADAGELANLLNNASGGLRQRHLLTVKCSGGQGRIEATVERYDSSQAI